jgi:hypothetical protein
VPEPANNGSYLTSNHDAQAVHGAKQVLFHAASAQSQCIGNSFSRPPLQVAQGKHLLLARGELTKRLPNPPASFPAEGFFLWRRSMAGLIQAQ